MGAGGRCRGHVLSLLTALLPKYAGIPPDICQLLKKRSDLRAEIDSEGFVMRSLNEGNWR